MQMLVGLPLTFVTASGLVALVALVVRLAAPAARRSCRSPPCRSSGSRRSSFYAWRYPSTDGDTVKALFLLPAAPAFAAAFGFAVDVARPHLPLVASARSRRPPRLRARRLRRVRRGMSDPREWRYLIASALGLLVLGGLWVAGWAFREARDVDPTALGLLSTCLEDERRVRVISPSGDPLADSAPSGSLRTTIEGNDVTVSIWADHEDATRTLETYARLTPREPRGACGRAGASCQSLGLAADG